MWYVEATLDIHTGEKLKYVGLTKDQSRALHSELSTAGHPIVRSGLMR